MHFQTTVDSPTLAFKSQHMCVWGSFFLGFWFQELSAFPRGSAHLEGFSCLLGMKVFLPNTKDKLLWRKILFLMKIQRGPQKSSLGEKNHITGIILDNVLGISPNGSGFHIQIHEVS